MIIINHCSVKFGEYAFEGVTCNLSENDEEMSIHIGSHDEAIVRLNRYFNENDLKGYVVVSGTDENGETRKFELQNPAEMQLNLDPKYRYLSLRFRK